MGTAIGLFRGWVAGAKVTENQLGPQGQPWGGRAEAAE